MIRLENALAISSQDVLKMPWRSFCKMFETVLKTSWRSLEDVLKTFWRCIEDVWPKWIYTSEDVWLGRIYSTWSRRLEYVSTTSSENEDERRFQDVFKMSSSRQIFAGQPFKNSWFNVTKMVDNVDRSSSIFILFISPWILFESVFSLRVPLSRS